MARRRSSKSVTRESNVITQTGSGNQCTAQEQPVRTSVIHVSPRRDSKDKDLSIPNVDPTFAAGQTQSMHDTSSTTDTKEHSPTHVAMQKHMDTSSNVQSRTTHVDNAEQDKYAHSDHLHTHADSELQGSLNCNETSLDSSSIEDSHLSIIENINISANDNSNFDCKTCVSHCHEPERHVKFRETLQSEKLIVEFPVDDGDISDNATANDISHSCDIHDINLNTSKRQRNEHKRRHTKSAPQQNRYRKSSDPNANSSNKRRRPSFQESLV